MAQLSSWRFLPRACALQRPVSGRRETFCALIGQGRHTFSIIDL